MSEREVRLPTVARPSAYLVAWGVFLTVPGMTAAIASGWLVGATTDPGPLAWGGLLVTSVGAVLLAVGVCRWAQHVDRAAGITHPAYVPEEPGSLPSMDP